MDTITMIHQEGIYGDHRLDNWVKNNYGENCDWLFIDFIEDEDVVVLLPDFIVIDSDDNKLVGIAIVKMG